MSRKGRKLLTRIGAGLMLGMSLLNFGAVWSRQQSGRIPRKTKNIRKNQLEQTDVEVLEIAQVAEREAGAVMREESLQQANQFHLYAEKSQESFLSGTAKHIAIFVWVVSATALFSSAVFNFPLALGKGALAFLPGIPHQGEIILKTEKNEVKEKEEFDLSVNIFRQANQVAAIRVSIYFDPDIFSFESYQLKEESGFNLGKRDVDQNKGVIDIFLYSNEEKKDKISDEPEILNLTFKPTGNVKAGEGYFIGVNEEESIMMNDNKKNILGKTNKVKLMITK